METKLFSVVTDTSAKGLKTKISAGKHLLYADEPLEVGGTDEGPSPYEILISALGACTGMTLSMYAKRKEMPLKSVKVHLRHDKVYVEDLVACDKDTSKIDVIYREIELEGDLNKDQRKSLLDIANKCPVHKSLANGINIKTVLRD
jgi:putative redox protein